MKLVAFDCSTGALSLGVFDSGKRLAGETTSSGMHSTTLAPAIEKALQKSGFALKDLDCIALGLGPGSFTGLRVAVTTAKTLAYAAKKNIVGVSSLEAMAQACSEKTRPIAVIGDGRKGMLYFALYRRTAKGLSILRKPALVDAEHLFQSFKGPAHFIGEVEKFMTRLSELSKKRVGITWDERNSVPKAEGVAEAAILRVRSKKFDDAFLLEPLYLHARDCNVTKK